MLKTLSIRTKFCQLICLSIILIQSLAVHSQGWRELNPPPNPFNRQIHTLVSTPAGQVYAAGDFKNEKGENIVAVLNGDLWTELGIGNQSLKANNGIYALAESPGKVYAAGIFSNQAGYPYVAQWDGNNWTELGSSPADFNNSIYSLTTDNAGNVYAAGAFTNAAGFSFVTKWNGNAWAELGSGANALNANGIIYAIATDIAGNVYAAGHFTNSIGRYYVAKWDGNNWSELGTGINALAADEYIQALLLDSTGSVYAAGSFKNSSGSRYVAKWNGTTWTEIGTGANALNANDVITTLVQQDNNLYAAGHLTDGAGYRSVYCWNGTTWQKVFVIPSNQASSPVHAMTTDAAGNIFVGGAFTNSSNRHYVAKWDGLSLTEPGRNGRNLEMWNGISHIAAGINGQVYAIGNTMNPSGNNIAHWDGKSWALLGADTAILHIDPSSSAMTTDYTGNLFVGSTFKNIHDNYYIAKWDGYSWSELGGANPIEAVEPITLLATDRQGNIYAGGAFMRNGSSFGPGVIKWDGSNATFYPSPGNPASICIDSTGNIYAGTSNTDGNGKYQVVKINEQGWQILGSGSGALNSGSAIRALAIDKKGNVLASGLNNEGWSTYNKFVAKWDGSAWSEAGSDPSGKYAEGSVDDMISDKYGNVYAAAHSGTGITYYTVAKWDGSMWTDMGLNAGTNVSTLATDLDGNIYAAGLFGNESNYQFVAKYEVGPGSIDLPTPIITGASASYCQQLGEQIITIENIPNTAIAEIIIKLDNKNITLASNNVIKFDTREMQPGLHTINVTYANDDTAKSASVTFEILPAAVPEVKLSANNDAGGDVTINATALAGGESPLFTFSLSPSFDNSLQAESSNNILKIKNLDLPKVENWIYVRMRSNANCIISPIAIDSVLVTRISSNGLLDPDFPGINIGSYPNPFTNSINVVGLNESKSYTISLVNSSGSPVFTQRVKNITRASLQLPVLAGNIYWLHIYDNTKNRRIGTMIVMKRGA